MKLPKHRRSYPLLLRQYKQQEKRIKDCGANARFDYLFQYPTMEGTFYSTKLNKR